ncbi:Hpt domain-containing protein [Pontiella agarivorans]|uniref:Hpt domain-containing protein n=1 Tax=Pontiella agarivorans TaxID=3038953 RepID=A0ABU5MSM6_9BACT|nr:Hpt domain-containing protein [Pontiella agarivorans]MDZ8117137.1 Hpt domain-containing protein [Pontiella agarivorans]
MAQIQGNTTWVKELIPELEARKSQFVVDTDEVDDELIEVFVDELHRLSGELQEGLDQKNTEMVRMAAHSIKGMGGTIGLPEISVLGLEIENCAKEDRLSDARRLVSALADWMKNLVNAE